MEMVEMSHLKVVVCLCRGKLFFFFNVELFFFFLSLAAFLSCFSRFLI